MPVNKSVSPQDKTEELGLEKLMCGIIMPIAPFDGCTAEHWQDVRDIVEEAIVSAEFLPNLVSNAVDVGIIHKRIIENLHDNPVVVCDVSGRNPNVMFELGLRLAFDKPTIIIKDDKTPYSFDTSPIEHLEYPRDLRFSRIVDFKKALCEKIQRTYERSQNDPAYTTFLKNFGTFKVAHLEKEEVSTDAFVLEEIRNLRLALQQLSGVTAKEEKRVSGRYKRPPTICIREATAQQVSQAFLAIKSTGIANEAKDPIDSNGHYHIEFPYGAISENSANIIIRAARKFAPDARWLSL